MKCTGIIVSTLRPPCGFLYALHPSTNQTSCACACLPVVAANGWPTTPKLSRLAINSTATSLALIAPSGVPPPDGVDMVAIVVCALVRMIELVEKPSEMGPLKKHSKKKAWQHLRSSLDKFRKPRVLPRLHHVQPGTQNCMFGVIADVSPIKYRRRPHGRIRSALYWLRTQDGFCVEHYFFETWVRRDDEKKIVPHGRQLCADRAEARCDTERPCEGERRRRR